VPPNYDSMIEIIVHGDTREQALASPSTLLNGGGG
jgi:acetyl/propionyl-CoA carboxylase alpha subunit